MGSSWTDLYRRGVEHHGSMQDLLTLAMQAAGASNAEGLMAEIRRNRVMPVYLICCELDRFGVQTPDSQATVDRVAAPAPTEQPHP